MLGDDGARRSAGRRPRSRSRSSRRTRRVLVSHSRGAVVVARSSSASSSPSAPGDEAELLDERRRAARDRPAGGAGARCPRAPRRTRAARGPAQRRDRARGRGRARRARRRARAPAARSMAPRSASRMRSRTSSSLPPLKSGPQDEHLGQHDAEREDVAPRVELAPDDLLGRHVAELALELSGVGAALDLRGARDAEVGELHGARCGR